MSAFIAFFMAVLSFAAPYSGTGHGHTLHRFDTSSGPIGKFAPSDTSSGPIGKAQSDGDTSGGPIG
jgi:hypothetical protein